MPDWHPLNPSHPGVYRIDAYTGRFAFEQPADLAGFRAELNRTIPRALMRADWNPERSLQQFFDDVVEFYAWRSRGLPPEHVKPAPRASSSWFLGLLGAIWRDYKLPPIASEALIDALANARPRSVAAHHERRA